MSHLPSLLILTPLLGAGLLLLLGGGRTLAAQRTAAGVTLVTLGIALALMFTIDPAGGVMEDDYSVTGSGMQLAYGLLEQEYEEGLSNDEAIPVAANAVKSAVERDTGSGNGVFIAEVTEEGVDIHGHTDFEEVL